MSLRVAEGFAADQEAAIEVWRAANTARGLPPSAERVIRVREKLAAHDACVVVGRVDGELMAMALVEAGRAEDGAGAIVPDRGHVSMVFVHPDAWGRGLGRALLRGLHARASLRGWRRTTLWTRESNVRALRLYESQGYHPTGREATLSGADRIIQLERP